MSTWGGKRPGAGRPAGSSGEKTRVVREMMDERGYNPIEAMMDIAQDPTSAPELRFQANKELARFYAPQLKAVEVTTQAEPMAVNIVRFDYGDQDESPNTGAPVGD